MTRRVVFVLLVCCALMSAARNASAQGTELGVSYANLTLIGSNGLPNDTYPLGWIAALAGRLDPHFAIVGEVNGNYRSETIGITDTRNSIYTFLGGPRIQNMSGRTTFFGQLLFGATHMVFSVPGSGFPDATDNGFVIQPGVGLDYSMAPRRAFRVQADVPFYRLGGTPAVNLHAFRLGLGIVFDLR